jgi:hypothetical protein
LAPADLEMPSGILRMLSTPRCKLQLFASPLPSTQPSKHSPPTSKGAPPLEAPSRFSQPPALWYLQCTTSRPSRHPPLLRDKASSAGSNVASQRRISTHPKSLSRPDPPRLSCPNHQLNLDRWTKHIMSIRPRNTTTSTITLLSSRSPVVTFTPAFALLRLSNTHSNLL